MKDLRPSFKRNKNRGEKRRLSVSIDADVFLFFAALARNGNSSIGRVLNKALRKRALQIQASIRGVAVENTFQWKLDTKTNEQRKD